MFVRQKVAKGRIYYQVVKNHRIGRRVQQTVLLSLREWPTTAAARAAIPERIAELERLIATKGELQTEAKAHRPWARYVRSGEKNWKWIYYDAGEDIQRAEREIRRLSDVLAKIEKLE